MIIAIKQSLCDTYLIINIWTYILKRTTNLHLKHLIKKFNGTCSENYTTYLKSVASSSKNLAKQAQMGFQPQM